MSASNCIISHSGPSPTLHSCSHAVASPPLSEAPDGQIPVVESCPLLMVLAPKGSWQKNYLSLKVACLSEWFTCSRWSRSFSTGRTFFPARENSVNFHPFWIEVPEETCVQDIAAAVCIMLCLMHFLPPGDWFTTVKDAHFHISIYQPHRNHTNLGFASLWTNEKCGNPFFSYGPLTNLFVKYTKAVDGPFRGWRV